MPEESPNEKKELPLSDKIADMAVKAIMTGGVSVGGFGAFWSLFKDSDIPKAIASGVIGIGVTYGASLLSPLHEGNKKRFGKLGNWLDKQLDGSIEETKWRFSGCDSKYLQQQGERCKEYYGIDVEDFKQPEGILQVNLADVFVPLNLDLSVGSFNSRSADEQDKTWEIWDFLAQARRQSSYRWMSILADGGSGKTTLLRHVGYELSRGKHRKYKTPKFLPFLLYLRKWRDTIAETPELTLPELMEKHVRSLRRCKDLQLPPNWAEERLRSGKALILFDGYDEVAKEQRKQVAEWISTQVAEYSESVFVLTSRPSGYDDFKTYATEVPTTLQVREFRKAERDIFIQKWYFSQERLFRVDKMNAAAEDDAKKKGDDLIQQIDGSGELQKMAANPLQLNLIARVHKFANGKPLPKQKTRLYQEIFDLQLGARPLAKRVDMLMDSASERQRVLQSIALTMLREDCTAQVERSQLLDWLRSALVSMDEVIEAESFLEQVEKVAELMYQADTDEFAFSHLSFRNYLAALECLRLENWDEVAEKFGSDGWRETILMLSGLQELQPRALYSLVQKSLKPKVLDVLPEVPLPVAEGSIYLAYDCLVRYPRQDKLNKLYPNWIEELKPLRYSKLELLLNSGQWEKADYETYLLMIGSVGKDKGQGFTQKDLIEILPEDDLRTIDRLWVEASKGHFGFSVQKNIWQECGSPMQPNKDWDRFCDRVGWKKNGNYVSYSDLAKDPSLSLMGELPRGGGWSLFSRAAICEL